MQLKFNLLESSSDARLSPSSVSSLMAIDLGVVERQYHKFTTNMPRVRPYYAVKANPDFEILKTLQRLGAGFDCASANEIDLALKAGADSNEDIIFANCCKFPGDVTFA